MEASYKLQDASHEQTCKWGLGFSHIQKIIVCSLVFSTKVGTNGYVNHIKACIVIKGYNQVLWYQFWFKCLSNSKSSFCVFAFIYCNDQTLSLISTMISKMFFMLESSNKRFVAKQDPVLVTCINSYVE